MSFCIKAMVVLDSSISQDRMSNLDPTIADLEQRIKMKEIDIEAVMPYDIAHGLVITLRRK